MNESLRKIDSEVVEPKKDKPSAGTAACFIKILSTKGDSRIDVPPTCPSDGINCNRYSETPPCTDYDPPPFSPFDRLRRTFATAPSPRKIKRRVPISSPQKTFIAMDTSKFLLTYSTEIGKVQIGRVGAGMKYILALDQGTTSSRALVINKEGKIFGKAQKEFRQIFPCAGWVEHDPMDIWATQAAVMTEAMSRAQLNLRDIASIGITNQRKQRSFGTEKPPNRFAMPSFGKIGGRHPFAKPCTPRGLSPSSNKKRGSF